MKTLIVDDELSARETLINYLTNYCQGIEIIGEAIDVPDAIAKIENLKPELVFLDVEMPFGNAFDVLEKTQHIPYHTIFITAYSDYAIKALNFSAAYYLLKPLDISELTEAVEKVKKMKDSKPTRNILLENIQNPGKEKIVIPSAHGFEVLRIEELILLEADGNYTNLYLDKDRRKIVTKQLKYFEDLLGQHSFLRLHKSYIVNLSQIAAYQRGKGGTVVMSNGKEVEVSPNKKEELLKYFGEN